MGEKKILGACFVGKYPVFVKIMEEKRKRKFQELEESNTTYNEHEMILVTYDGAQMVNNAKKKLTLFLSAHRYLMKEAFVRLD